MKLTWLKIVQDGNEHTMTMSGYKNMRWLWLIFWKAELRRYYQVNCQTNVKGGIFLTFNFTYAPYLVIGWIQAIISIINFYDTINNECATSVVTLACMNTMFMHAWNLLLKQNYKHNHVASVITRNPCWFILLGWCKCYKKGHVM